ncbi:MAG: thioredoxin family protein [Candidatus Alcyoniella australis]|nr:thioredoxin family protein [Candidatus Alcyoniella australis]
MKIKVLGPGCRNCHALLETTKTAVAELGLDAEIEYVTDIDKIIEYVALTPGLVVDGKVVHQGKPLPKLDAVKRLLKEAK